MKGFRKSLPTYREQSDMRHETTIHLIPANSTPGLAWPRLIPGTLVKRYKRFMADVKLRNGHIVTAHCPNSGSMKGCCEPGRTVYLSRSSNPARRLRYTWELIRMPSSLVGVNTLVPNRLVAQSIMNAEIAPLAGYARLQREVACGTRSRLDLLLECSDHARCYVEIKNCTLVDEGFAYFPDAVTERGRKHLGELRQKVRSGDRAVILFLIQRMDSTVFRPADHIDPDYGRELRKVCTSGVEALAYDVSITLERITVRHRVPCEL